MRTLAHNFSFITQMIRCQLRKGCLLQRNLETELKFRKHLHLGQVTAISSGKKYTGKYYLRVSHFPVTCLHETNKNFIFVWKYELVSFLIRRHPFNKGCMLCVKLLVVNVKLILNTRKNCRNPKLNRAEHKPCENVRLISSQNIAIAAHLQCGKSVISKYQN